MALVQKVKALAKQVAFFLYYSTIGGSFPAPLLVRRSGNKSIYFYNNDQAANDHISNSDGACAGKKWLIYRRVIMKHNNKTLTNLQKHLVTTLTPTTAVRFLGEPDRQTGSGLIIFEYDLNDGTMLRLGFPGYRPIQYAHHIDKDGKSVNMPLI